MTFWNYLYPVLYRRERTDYAGMMRYIMAVTAFLPHKVCGQRCRPPFFLQKSLVSRLFLLNLHRAFECSRAFPYGYAYAAELLSQYLNQIPVCYAGFIEKTISTL